MPVQLVIEHLSVRLIIVWVQRALVGSQSEVGPVASHLHVWMPVQFVHVLTQVETAIDQESCTHLAEQHLSFRLILLYTYILYSSTQVVCQ